MTTLTHPGVRPVEVALPWTALRSMIRLARELHSLSLLSDYGLTISPALSPHGRQPAANHGVPMGYDFHLTPEGPRLIEVNTNAGGLILSWLAHHGEHWPDWHTPVPPLLLQHWLNSPLAAAFRTEATLCGIKVERVVILDDDPQEQFLYPEMVAFQHLFRAMGWQAEIASPEELVMDETGVFWQGQPVQLVYNRHCDFYLETPPLAGLAAAWQAGRVCLTPNPRVYGLLADKQRMVLWRNQPTLLAMGVEQKVVDHLQSIIPPCDMLDQMDGENLWQSRKKWVLKPVSSFGSRGVILGDSMSRTRFNSLPPATTLAQAMVAPSVVNDNGELLKCDWRLFTYQEKVLAVAARLYKGQVTNLRSSGSGFAKVTLVKNSG